ncbi:hypothetical protein MAR_002486 [Mya arenaria]|uniref:Uncharacterized protein n=1 Tax=Mya arenaria TaxID=6604 RepID=A0ABY7FIY6_MYAAR|nr:hypothetical protein MAR_002486 [Mya arenaria]
MSLGHCREEHSSGSSWRKACHYTIAEGSMPLDHQKVENATWLSKSGECHWAIVEGSMPLDHQKVENATGLSKSGECHWAIVEGSIPLDHQKMESATGLSQRGAYHWAIVEGSMPLGHTILDLNNLPRYIKHSRNRYAFKNGVTDYLKLYIRKTINAQIQELDSLLGTYDIERVSISPYLRPSATKGEDSDWDAGEGTWEDDELLHLDTRMKDFLSGCTNRRSHSICDSEEQRWGSAYIITVGHHTNESKFKSNNSSKKDVKSANLDCKEELKRETKVRSSFCEKRRTTLKLEFQLRWWNVPGSVFTVTRWMNSFFFAKHVERPRTYEPSGSEEVVKQYRRKQLERGSAAQFRFKDEKDWDHDQGSANVGTLNLDLHGLIKSLDCIPMHQRLGIDEGLFSQDQMCEILSYSSKNQEKYDKQKRQQKTAQPTVVVSSNGKHANGKQLKANAKKVNSKDHRKQNSIEPEANNKIRVTNASRDEVIGTKNYMSLSKPPDVKKLEDDLDALLGLSDTNCAIHEEHHTESADENTHKREDVKNAQTMSPDKPCDTGVVKKKVSVSENGAPVKKGDNLEDWLDDFLDD